MGRHSSWQRDDKVIALLQEQVTLSGFAYSRPQHAFQEETMAVRVAAGNHQTIFTRRS